MKLVNTLRALGAAALAVSLAGCMKMDMQLELNTDDTVDGSMVFALSKDLAGLAEANGQDMSSLFDEMDVGDLPENATTEEYEDDDYVGQQFTFTDAALSDFTDDEGFGIVHEGNEFVLTGELPMGDMGDMAGMNPEDLGADMGQLGDPEALMDSFDIRLSVTFPGEVLEHNGELDGTTVTWVPTPGENLTIEARAEDSGAGGGFPMWLWIVIAVVVAAAVIGLLLFLARKRRQPATTADAFAPPPPPPPGEAAEPGQGPSS